MLFCWVQAQAQHSAAALQEDFEQEERLITLTPQGLDWGDRLAALLPNPPPAHWAAAGALFFLPPACSIVAALRPCYKGLQQARPVQGMLVRATSSSG